MVPLLPMVPMPPVGFPQEIRLVPMLPMLPMGPLQKIILVLMLPMVTMVSMLPLRNAYKTRKFRSCFSSSEIFQKILLSCSPGWLKIDFEGSG